MKILFSIILIVIYYYGICQKDGTIKIRKPDNSEYVKKNEYLEETLIYRFVEYSMPTGEKIREPWKRNSLNHIIYFKFDTDGSVKALIKTLSNFGFGCYNAGLVFNNVIDRSSKEPVVETEYQIIDDTICFAIDKFETEFKKNYKAIIGNDEMTVYINIGSSNSNEYSRLYIARYVLCTVEELEKYW